MTVTNYLQDCSNTSISQFLRISQQNRNSTQGVGENVKKNSIVRPSRSLFIENNKNNPAAATLMFVRREKYCPHQYKYLANRSTLQPSDNENFTLGMNTFLFLVIFIKSSDNTNYLLLSTRSAWHAMIFMLRRVLFSPGRPGQTLHFVKWLSIWTVRLWKRKQEKIQTKHYFTLTWLDLTSCLCKTRQNIFFPNLTFLTWTWSGNILVFRSLTDYISVILTKDYTEHWIEY